jgi:hypothetical protein
MWALLLACDIPDLVDDGRGDEPELTDFGDYDVFVNGFHYGSGEPAVQMEADHYCDQRLDGTIACVLYDVDGRLMGIEHIVPRDVFVGFTATEKALWHAHNYEVLSGLLIAPELGATAEHALMTQLVATYGKTWHVTEDGDLGGPATLMKSFYKDGQIDAQLVEARDARFGVVTASIRQSRADIEDPGADPLSLQEPFLGICDEPTVPAP